MPSWNRLEHRPCHSYLAGNGYQKKRLEFNLQWLEEGLGKNRHHGHEAECPKHGKRLLVTMRNVIDGLIDGNKTLMERKQNEKHGVRS